MKIILKYKIIFFSFLIFFWVSIPCYALDINMQWDENTESDLGGYKVYYKALSSGAPYNGSGATEGNSPIDIGAQSVVDGVVTFTVSGLTDGELYCFAITAYSNSGTESGYSNEVCTLNITSPLDNFLINAASDYSNYPISGTANASASVEVFAGGTSLGTVTANGSNGNWTIYVNFNSISEGTVNLNVLSNGNTSPVITGTFDKTPSGIPGNLLVQ